MTIQEFIDAQQEDRRPLLSAVYAALQAAIPDAEERISWGMPTFWKGKNIIHFAPAKNHLGIYPGPAAIEAFAKELEGYQTSKGAIQFPYSKPLPLELIGSIAVWSYERNADGTKGS